MARNRSGWLGLAIGVGCGLLGIGGCTFDPIEAPTWDVLFQVPLFKKTYTMTELAEKDDQIEVKGGRLVFRKRDTLAPFEVGSSLSMAGGRTQTPLVIPPGAYPGFEMTARDTIDLSDEMVLQQAVIHEGIFHIHAVNNTPLTVELTLSVPSITLTTWDDGNPWMWTSSAYSTRDHGVNLTHARVTPPIIGGINRIPVAIRLRVVSGWTEWGDRISLEMALTNLVFEEVTGWIRSLRVPFEPRGSTLELPKELEGFQYAPLEAIIGIDNQVACEGRMDLTITGMKTGSSPVQISGTGNLASRRRTEIRVRGMEQIVNAYPDSLLFSGTASFGGAQNPVTVRQRDRIQVDWALEIPAVFSLDPRENRTDPDTLKLSEEARKNIKKHIGEGHLFVEVENHLPFGVDLTVYFSRYSDFYERQRPTDVRKTLSLKPGIVRRSGDPPGTIDQPLHVLQPVTSRRDFGLSEQEIRLFSEPPVYWGVRLKYAGTEGFVEVREADYIAVKTWLDLTVRLGETEEAP